MEVKIYKAFIASPSDTYTERNLCDKIFDEINSGLADAHPVRYALKIKPQKKNRSSELGSVG